MRIHARVFHGVGILVTLVILFVLNKSTFAPPPKCSLCACKEIFCLYDPAVGSYRWYYEPGDGSKTPYSQGVLDLAVGTNCCDVCVGLFDWGFPLVEYKCSSNDVCDAGAGQTGKKQREAEETSGGQNGMSVSRLTCY